MNTWDLAVTRWVNAFGLEHPQWDRLLAHLAFSDLFKGAITMGVICWLFARQRSTQSLAVAPSPSAANSLPSHPPSKQAALCSLIACTGVALAANRILASILPLRSRPLHTTELIFRDPGGIPPTAFSDLSAFPSDHAVLFFALSLGALFHRGWRIIGCLLVVHATLVCALRVYLGLHWLTDILGGLVLAALFAFISTLPATIRLLGTPLIRIQHRAPGLFTALAFFTAWQFATLFQPLVALAEFLRH